MMNQINLFAPLAIRGVTLRNRIAVSPMCQYSSEEGKATEWHLVHLGSRAVGGASLVMVEATAVEAIGRISPQDMGIWSDSQIEPLARITRFVSSQASCPAIQLAHAGRKASTKRPWDGHGVVPPEEGGWEVVGPSDIPFSVDYPNPKPLDEEGIKRIIGSFRQAAKRSLQAGFQIIEIHSAHGYLLHSFLSPLSNKRTDKYGGSFENRIRLLVEVADAVRGEIPNSMPLFVRISATDWVEGGWTDTDAVELSKILADHGVDLIDCSSGGNVSHAKIPIEPGYQVPFAECIRKEAKIMTGAVGMITGAQHANEILETGKADIIFLARQFLRDPYWPLHAAQILGVDFPWPVQYLRAKE